MYLYQHVINLTHTILTLVVGGGVELPSLYPQWRVEYSGLESPRHIHASLTKLLEGIVHAQLL